jgi:hypothetical protein
MNEAKFLRDFAGSLQERDLFLIPELAKRINEYLEEFHTQYEHIIFKEKSGIVYGGVEWKFDDTIPENEIHVDGKIYKLWEGDKNG